MTGSDSDFFMNSELVFELLGPDLQVVFSEEAVLESMKMETKKRMLYDMLASIQQLHSFGVCSNDVKIENFALVSFDLPSSMLLDVTLKLVDLGHASVVGSPLSEPFGTLLYRAPETIGIHISHWSIDITGYSRELNFNCTKSDVYAVGVIAYTILTGGYLPFYLDGTQKETITRGKITERLYHEHFLGLLIKDDVSRDLVRGLLDADPDTRMSVDDAMAHPFFAVAV
jgi:serine/threonine protein kinase